jgi:hypothetical protein
VVAHLALHDLDRWQVGDTCHEVGDPPRLALDEAGDGTDRPDQPGQVQAPLLWRDDSAVEPDLPGGREDAVVRKEREADAVTRAADDGVDFLAGPVGEPDGRTVDPLHRGFHRDVTVIDPAQQLVRNRQRRREDAVVRLRNAVRRQRSTNDAQKKFDESTLLLERHPRPPLGGSNFIDGNAHHLFRYHVNAAAQCDESLRSESRKLHGDVRSRIAETDHEGSSAHVLGRSRVVERMDVPAGERIRARYRRAGRVPVMASGHHDVPEAPAPPRARAPLFGDHLPRRVRQWRDRDHLGVELNVVQADVLSVTLQVGRDLIMPGKARVVIGHRKVAVAGHLARGVQVQ